MKITIAKDDSGDFKTISEALESVKTDEGAEIFIKKGCYFEKVKVTKPNIKLVGEDAENTIIVYNDCAYRKDENDEYLGTFKTATLEVTENATDVLIKNLTIENSAGYGKIVGQAVALSMGGDRGIAEGCRLIGRQDTLMMPPCFEEAQADPDIYVRQYFKNCYIEGDVDFIFGGAAAIFDNCSIYCRHRPIGFNCFVTAACTPANCGYGFVFRNCTIDGEAEKNTVYLGRPWLPSARTVFINTKASDVLSPQVWIKWSNIYTHDAACYAQNSFTDTSQVAPWTQILTDEDVKEYTPENVFGGWIPKA